MKSLKVILLAFAFSSTAGAATLQTIYIQGPAGTQKPAPMPAPAETSHYASTSQSQATRG